MQVKLFDFLAALVELAGAQSLSIASSAQHLALSLVPTHSLTDLAALVIKAGYDRALNATLNNPTLSIYLAGQAGLTTLAQAPGQALLNGDRLAVRQEPGERSPLCSLVFENSNVRVNADAFYAYANIPTYTPSQGWLAYHSEFHFDLTHQGQILRVEMGLLPHAADRQVILTTHQQEGETLNGGRCRPAGLGVWDNPAPLRISVRSAIPLPASRDTLALVWQEAKTRLLKTGCPRFIQDSPAGEVLQQCFNTDHPGLADAPQNATRFSRWILESLGALAGLTGVSRCCLEGQGFRRSRWFDTGEDSLGVVGYQGWNFLNLEGVSAPLLVMPSSQPAYRPTQLVTTRLGDRRRFAFETVLDPGLQVDGVPLPYYLLDEGHPYQTPDGQRRVAKYWRLIIRAQTVTDAVQILLAGKAADVWYEEVFASHPALRTAHPVFNHFSYGGHLQQDPLLFALWLVRAAHDLPAADKALLTRIFNRLIEVSQKNIADVQADAAHTRVENIRGAKLAVAVALEEVRRKIIRKFDLG